MPFGWFLKMFFVWFGGKMHARTKTWTFPTQRERTHTLWAFITRRKKKREREKETKCI